MDEYRQLCEVSKEKIPFSAATTAAINIMNDPEVCGQVGLSSDEMVNSLGGTFAKYEIPMGLMNKLIVLSEYHELEFLIDNSGSMSQKSEKGISRWQEAYQRLKEMVEILAHVPIPKITIRFFNKFDRKEEILIALERNNETPEKFIEYAYKQIQRPFLKQPLGTTPIREELEKSFARGAGKKIARYIFCDGNPDNESDKELIENLLKNRPAPENTPVTFISCTEVDEEAEWMKETEEVAPYCAEFDDFKSEATEVALDQGKALPFTKGFYLVCQLVAAMNPDDLDAMDESIPLTKYTLDNLLGPISSEQDYHHYFNCFIQAQQERPCTNDMDKLKKSQYWGPHFHAFLNERMAKNIPAVKEFKEKLKGKNPHLPPVRPSAPPGFEDRPPPYNYSMA